MDVSEIIMLSRKQTGTSAGQISDSDYLDYLNIVYKDVFSRLSVNSKKYTWQTYKTDVIAGQQEYIIPQPSNTQTGLKLLLDCFYIHEGKDRRIPLYDTNTSINYHVNENHKPYCVYRDGSVFLYPTPTENITGGLRLEGKYIPLELTLTNTSDEIKLAPEYHNILVKGLNAYVFGEKQVYDKQQYFESEYNAGVRQIQEEGSFDNESAYHVEDAYLGFLE